MTAGHLVHNNSLNF